MPCERGLEECLGLCGSGFLGWGLPSGKGPRPVSANLLSAQEAAHRLGISAATLYDWLGQSDRGLLVIRGQQVSVQYFQGGPRGQGRIHVEVAEVERIKDLMRVRPQPSRSRRLPVRQDSYPGITVPLGHPEA